MTLAMLDVIVIRGAPGVGKSRAAKLLAARLGRGARVEVDTLRAMIIPVEWTNQVEHASVLSIAVGVVAAFLEMGHRPVVVVDTFSGNKLARFLTELRAVRHGIDVRAVALVATPDVLRSRVESRSAGEFKDITICERLNAEVNEYLVPGEYVLDNSSLTPEETVVAILGALGERPTQ